MYAGPRKAAISLNHECDGTVAMGPVHVVGDVGIAARELEVSQEHRP
jgi:hypothetical protein